MRRISPLSLKKSILFLLAFIVACVLYGQEITPSVVKYSHPLLTRVNQLASSQKFKQAIELSLEQAKQMKEKQDWEGYMTFMLRAAEVETFEIWKSVGLTENQQEVDYRRALRILDSLQYNAGQYLDDYPYLKANVLFTQAVVYDWVHLPEVAERMHIDALKLRENLYGKESREVADSYLWMGIMYHWGLRRKDLAKSCFQKALLLQKKYLPDSRHSLGTTYYGLSILARDNFEFDEAEAMSKEYYSLYLDLPFQQAYSYHLFATIHSFQGNYEKALSQRMASLKIHEAGGNIEQLVPEYNELADNLKSLGRYAEARDVLYKTQRILGTDGSKSPYYTIGSYENLGDLYRVMGKYDSSEYYFNQAIHNAIKFFGKRNEELAVAYGYRGKLFIQKKEFQSGLEDFQQMLSTIVNDFNPQSIYSLPKVQKENPYSLNIIAACFNKGDAFFEWYIVDKDLTKLESALDNYRMAYQHLVIARRNIEDELSKSFLMLQFESSIEKSLSCVKMLYDKTNDAGVFQSMFQFVEVTKYLNVLDALQRAERANNSLIPKSIHFELEDIRKELNDLQKKILTISETATDSISELNKEVLNLIQQRKELVSQMAVSPGSVTSNLDSLLITIPQIKSQLRDHQILEFYWGKDSIYVLSITSSATEIHSIPHTQKNEQLFLEVYHHMNGMPSFGQEDVKNYSQWTSAIFNIFFKPFIRTNKLIVVPEGLLNLISVEALVVEEKPENNSYSTLDYMINNYEISYGYSSSILFKNHVRKASTANRILAFSYSNESAGQSMSKRNAANELPGTYKELEVLSKLFKNVKRFTDKDASKINFINNTKGYDIIHLAVHGVGDQNEMDNSRLIFRRDSLNDHELFAYEIYNLRLDASLVVLSGCESGIGHNQAGEGVFSMARAFTYAGCPSVVMSLWQVPDVFTADIITDFYEYVNHGESVSSSLRHAKLQFLKQSDGYTAHPANWAAFVVNGQDLTFKSKTQAFYWVYALVALVLILILAAYMKRRA